MAHRERRGSSAAAARLIHAAVWGLAIVLLLRAARGGQGLEAADRPAPEGPRPQAAATPPAPAQTPPAAAFLRRDDPARPAPWNAPLAGRIARWNAEAARRSKAVPSAGAVEVSLCVRDLATGEELAAIEADRSMRPASNLKLVTAAAALVLFGPAQAFGTVAEGRGELDGGVLQGDLVLRAGGDPVVSPDGDARVEARLDELCDGLRERGLRRIAGDLVLDEASFAEPGPAPGWPDAGQHWAEYCALSGGFNLNGGVLRASVEPGRVGQAARIEVHPAPHGLRESYGVTTVARGHALDVRVGATLSAVTVRGELPWRADAYEAEFSHPDPILLFGSVLRERLARAGIALDGQLRRERGAPAGVPLARMRSPILGTLAPINAESRNGVADQLFLSIGNWYSGSGTRAAASAATARALERLGVPSEGLVQVDGSGLSRDNRVSARQIVALLEAVLSRDDAMAHAFQASLAVAGTRGTLSERLVGTAAEGRVFAKTGWIAGTSALSGVARTSTGRRLVFSILVEYPRSAGGLNTHCFKPMQDELVLALVEERP